MASDWTRKQASVPARRRASPSCTPRQNALLPHIIDGGHLFEVRQNSFEVAQAMLASINLYVVANAGTICSVLLAKLN